MTKRRTRPAGWQQAIAGFPEELRPELDALWDLGGALAPDLVARLLGAGGGDLGAVMMRLLPLAGHYAVVPASHYPVGTVVAGLARRGRAPALYFGANHEFRGIALSFTVHAEQAAINHAWLRGERGVAALAVTAAPCGYCRQFLNELATAGSLDIYLPRVGGTGHVRTSVAELLPAAFGPTALGVTAGLMRPRRRPLRLEIRRRRGADAVIDAALAAAEASYAPYPTDRSGQFAGVALELADGSIWPGRYAGNAAYNPSMSPLESAISLASLSRSRDAGGAIKRCVLVEVPTLASQRSATEAVLAVTAPDVTLEYFPAKIAAPQAG